jgi:hypothetical protein
MFFLLKFDALQLVGTITKIFCTNLLQNLGSLHHFFFSIEESKVNFLKLSGLHIYRASTIVETLIDLHYLWIGCDDLMYNKFAPIVKKFSI